MSFKPQQKITVGPGVQLVTGLGRFEPAVGTVTLTTGTLTAINVTNKGEGYINSTDATVTIAGDGTAATGTATLGNGFVVFVPVTTIGKGYLVPPAVTFSGGGGSGATARAVIGPNGCIEKIVVDTGGSNYTSVPTAAIAAAPANGTNAVLGTVQCSFQITGGTVTAAGSGYTAANTTITFGNPRQAILSLGLSTILGANVLTIDERAVASGETVKMVWPAIGNRNTPDPEYTASIKGTPRAQIVIQSVTTSTYSIGLQYQAQVWGR